MSKESELRDEIGLLLAITSQLFQSRMDHLLANHSVSYSQFSLLTYLSGVGTPASISTIADAMEINQPGVTKVVKRLAEMNLVTVAPDPTDSRRRLVEVGPGAAQLLNEIDEDLDIDSVGWFRGWDEADLSGFRDRLNDLVTFFDANRL